MIIKTLIVTVILVAIVLLALGVKILFYKDASYGVYSCCGLDSNSGDVTCCQYQVKGEVNRPKTSKRY